MQTHFVTVIKRTNPLLIADKQALIKTSRQATITKLSWRLGAFLKGTGTGEIVFSSIVLMESLQCSRSALPLAPRRGGHCVPCNITYMLLD